MTIGIHRSQLKIVIENLGYAGLLAKLPWNDFIFTKTEEVCSIKTNAALHTVEQTIKAGLLIT